MASNPFKMLTSTCVPTISSLFSQENYPQQKHCLTKEMGMFNHYTIFI